RSSAERSDRPAVGRPDREVVVEPRRWGEAVNVRAQVVDDGDGCADGLLVVALAVLQVEDLATVGREGRLGVVTPLRQQLFARAVEVGDGDAGLFLDEQARRAA